MDHPLERLLAEYLNVYAAIPDDWRNVAPKTFVLGQLSGISKAMKAVGLYPEEVVEAMERENLSLTNQARGTLLAILGGSQQVPVSMFKVKGRRFR